MTQLTKLEECLADGSIWRMSALADQGITGATVRRAIAAGLVLPVSRGLYRAAQASYVDGLQFAEVLARAPQGVICLHSAAETHGLGDVVPGRVWVALPNHLKVPKLDWPPVRFLRWRNGARFQVGIERRPVAGVSVRITSRARTVVDMLCMPDLVGKDRALQCLRDYVQQGHGTTPLSEIAHQLDVGRKLSVYLELAAAFAGVR